MLLLYITIAIVAYISLGLYLFVSNKELFESECIRRFRDAELYFPGGFKKRIETVQNHIERYPADLLDRNYFYGSRGWQFKEIVLKNLYKDCAKDIFPGALKFWSQAILIPLVWILVTPLICLGVRLMRPPDVTA